MRIAITLLALALFCLPARADKRGVDVRMPLVEETLRFLKLQALSPPSDAEFLRAGVIRVCGEKLDRSGCRPTDVPIPGVGADGPSTAHAWRRILESVLAAESIRQGRDFDKVAFQRYVMDGMVETLGDPGSFYLIPSVYRKITSIPSDFVGFGLRVIPEKDCLKVSAVHLGSPARKAGIDFGDQIIEVNGSPVTGYRRPFALAALWGAEGNTIKLTLKRDGKKKRKVTVVYKPWSFSSYRIRREGDVIILSIRYFDRGMLEALRFALAGSVTGLVLDFQDAASGDEGEMIGLADLLLAKGSIGSKKTRADLGSRSWNATSGPDECLDLPIVAIINGGTSGLAEVLVAALRKHTRAVLVGQTTAGCDTQETIRPFSDGSAVQVTSTRLFGPDETSFKDGVVPHLKTDRSAIVDLGVTIVRTTAGAGIEQLLEAGGNAVAKP